MRHHCSISNARSSAQIQTCVRRRWRSRCQKIRWSVRGPVDTCDNVLKKVPFSEFRGYSYLARPSRAAYSPLRADGKADGRARLRRAGARRAPQPRASGETLERVATVGRAVAGRARRGGPAARPRRTADDHHRTGSGPSGHRAGRGQTTPGLWPRTGSKAGRGSAQPQVLTLSTCCCLDPHRDTRSHFQHVGAPYQWRSQPAGLHVAHMDMHHAHHYRTLVLWASHCIFIFPRVCRLTTVCHTILSSPIST